MKSFMLFSAIVVACGPAYGSPLFDDVLCRQRTAAVTLQLEPARGCTTYGYAARLVGRGVDDAAESAGFSAGHSPLTEGAASFLLPGLGQYRMGRTLRSRVFFGLEGITWIAIGSFLWQGYAREKAYKDYAVAYAHVSGTDHPSEYWEKVGQFRSNDGPLGYNEYVMREARDLYYPDRAAMNEYYEANKITGILGWRWDTEKTFGLYNELRDGSRAAERRALYAVAFAFALRVVSAADAVRLARGESGQLRDDSGRLSLHIDPRCGGFLLSLKQAF